MRELVRRLLGAAGYEVRRISQHEPKWSDTVEDYYPLQPKPRQGHGLPPHAGLRDVLERDRDTYKSVLGSIASAHSILHGIPQEPTAGRPDVPFWRNHWFSVLDAAALVSFLCARRPARYMEIGSGHSTRFASYAIRAAGLPTHITSIDPHPRAEIDTLCDSVLRQPLENCSLAVFDTLERGDILFFDGSHRVFQNSDVTVFFLEVIPRLKPGVLVHIHDIFLPDDYPPAWKSRLYSEQYMLAAMLACGSPPFRVVLPNHFVCADPGLSALVRNVFAGEDGRPDIPFLYPIEGHTIAGVSFWVETVSARGDPTVGDVHEHHRQV